MRIGSTLGYALAGALSTNGVPHFVKGIVGQPHTTLIERRSSAHFNAAYGTVTLALGYALLRDPDSSGGVEPANRQLAMALGGLLKAVGLGGSSSRPDAKFP